MKVYKIQRKSDGLFSTGGMSPTFSKTGKTWNAIGHLKNHLNQFIRVFTWDKETRKGEYKDTIGDVYTGCEIVTYELVSSTAEVERKDVC